MHAGVASRRPRRASAVGGGAGSDEPLYTGAGNQTLVFHGDSSSPLMATVTAAGAADSNMKLCPKPSLNISGEAVNTAETDLVTGRNGTGKAWKLIYAASGPSDQDPQPGPEVILCRTPNYTGIRSQVVTYWSKIELISGSFNTIEYKGMYFSDNQNGGGAFPLYCVHSLSGVNPQTGAPNKGSFWQLYNTGLATSDQSTQPIGPYFDDVFNDGIWHRFTHIMRPHSSSGVKDGWQAMWIDGVRVTSTRQSDVGVTPADGWKQWCSQAQVDALNVASESDNFTTIIHGGPESSQSNPSWAQLINVDDYSYHLET